MQEFEEERDPLQKQLSNIEQIFQEFADQYESASRALRDGFVPDPIPSIQLDAARKVVNDTFSAISEAGKPFDMDPLSENSSLATAAEYLSLVIEARTRAEKQRQMLDDATEIVAGVLALDHASNPEELAEVKARAEDLKQELEAQNMTEAEQLLSGSHPIAMLAAYARHRDTLNDDEYDDFRQTIQQQFGRSLLRDIDRGRVTFVSEKLEQEEVFNTVISDEIDAIPTIIEEATGLLDEEELADDSQFDPITEIEIDEELLEEAKTDTSEDSLPPLYSDYDSGEGEDTLLPFLEGDGMNFENNEMPEATVNSPDEDQKDSEEENE